MHQRLDDRGASVSRGTLQRLINRFSAKLEKRRGRVVGKFRRLFGLTYVSPLSEADMFEALRFKSVALVGNARSLSESDFGASIDNHDLVIRCNQAPMPDKRSHGARTDWIATSIELDRQIIAQKGASHLLWMSPPRNALPGWILKWPNFFLYPSASHKALCAKVGDRPTTGLMLIDLLERSPCLAVSLYGFDFYRSLSLSNEHNSRETPHDYVTEESYVRKLLASDHRFSLNINA